MPKAPRFYILYVVAFISNLLSMPICLVLMTAYPRYLALLLGVIAVNIVAVYASIYLNELARKNDPRSYYWNDSVEIKSTDKRHNWF